MAATYYYTLVLCYPLGTSLIDGKLWDNYLLAERILQDLDADLLEDVNDVELPEGEGWNLERIRVDSEHLTQPGKRQSNKMVSNI